jgi:hypothetical protein
MRNANIEDFLPNTFSYSLTTYCLLYVPSGKTEDSLNFATKCFMNSMRFLNSAAIIPLYSGADKSLSLQGRKQATETEDLDFHIFHLLSEFDEY